MKRTIGLDLDGVLYPWHQIIYEEVKFRKGIEEDYREFWRKAKEENYHRVLLEALVEVPMFYSQRDIRSHVLEVVNELAKMYQIFYITTRPESARSATLNWIERSKLPYASNLIITQNKKPYISMLECDYFVDDKHKTIDDIKDITNAILFKADYFYDEDVEGYNYIETLDELLEIGLRRIFGTDVGTYSRINSSKVI